MMFKDFIVPASYTTADAKAARNDQRYKLISEMYVNTVIIGGGSIIDFARKLIKESQE